MNLGASIEFLTDSKLFFDQFSKVRDKAKDSINADQFLRFCQLIEDKNLQVRVRRMPSHLDIDPTKVRPDCVRDSDILGNDKADKLADLSAKSPLDFSLVLKYFKTVKLVRNIQSRLAVILCNLPNRPKQKKILVPKEALVPLSSLAATSKHVVLLEGSRYSCTVCKQFASGSREQIVSFLGSRCVPPVSTSGAGVDRIMIPISLGGKVSHPSHSIGC